jgi:tRNA threonylcarbamoyladenosine biosynthesis protein TsaE
MDEVTASPGETEALAARLAGLLEAGDVVAVSGELGAGKTTFVRGLARGLGCPGPVQSPTFQLVRVYPGRVQLGHVDLYRLEPGAGIADLGLDDLLEQGVVAVEWGDRLRLDHAGAIRVELTASSPGERVIRLP